jgi:hypothetical protein
MEDYSDAHQTALLALLATDIEEELRQKQESERRSRSRRSQAREVAFLRLQLEAEQWAVANSASRSSGRMRTSGRGKTPTSPPPPVAGLAPPTSNMRSPRHHILSPPTTTKGASKRASRCTDERWAVPVMRPAFAYEEEAPASGAKLPPPLEPKKPSPPPESPPESPLESDDEGEEEEEYSIWGTSSSYPAMLFEESEMHRRELEQWRKEEQSARAEHELEACTFSPAIDARSRKIAEQDPKPRLDLRMPELLCALVRIHHAPFPPPRSPTRVPTPPPSCVLLSIFSICSNRDVASSQSAWRRSGGRSIAPQPEMPG